MTNVSFLLCLEQALNCYSQLPKGINWPVPLKTLKSIIFLKIQLGYALVSSNRVKLEAHLTRNEHATEGEADTVIEVSSEEEEGNGKAKAPRATDIHTKALPLLI